MIRYDGRVAIVTGAGGGLGRAYALALAARGARVVVNDYGGSVTGAGGSAGPAETVVAEIRAAGGEALPHVGSVADPADVAAMVRTAQEAWGRVDLLVNNAGILRDKSFAKMEVEDWDAVHAVHLRGAFLASRAVWETMRAQQFGRIVMTSSSSGLFGNFGQANYSAAKMGLVGLMNTLAIEGRKYNIHVNALAPTAGTRMLEGLVPPEIHRLFDPSWVVPAVLYLLSDDAPTKTILLAGAGGYERAYVTMTDGIFLPEAERTPESLAGRFAEISDRGAGEQVPEMAGGQTQHEMAKATRARA